MGTATSWNPGSAGSVYALSVKGDTIYAGGSFSEVGAGICRRNAAAFDLNTGDVTAWAPDVNSTVYSVVAGTNDEVYVGGMFQLANVQQRNRLCAIDLLADTLTDWNPDVNGTVQNVDGIVFTMALVGETLYAGGSFTLTNGGTVRSNLAAFDTTVGTVNSWNPEANSSVLSLVPSDGIIYAGGTFTMVNGSTARNRVAALDASTGTATSWAPELNSAVRGIAIHDGIAYLAGQFTAVDGTPRNRAAAVEISTGSLTDWNPNLNNQVNSIVVYGNRAYLGGIFTSVNGGLTRPRIAAFDLSTGTATDWDPVLSSTVYSIYRYGSNLYVGGSFVSVDGDTQFRFAGLTLDPSSTLPVNWLSLNARLNVANQAVINWQVSEENVRGYTVQKSVDGRNFQHIASVSSRGDGIHQYSVAEVESLQGKAYYRILQEDWDGKYSYSSVLSLTNAIEQFSCKIAPNPSQGNTRLTLYSPKDEKLYVSIIDQTGKTILLKSLQVQQGVQVMSLETSGYKPGLYQVVIQTATGRQNLPLLML
jgi:hypothetical protein